MTLTGGYFNKKGSISDMIFLIILLVVVATITVVSWKMYKAVDDNLQSSNQISAEGKAISTSLRGRFTAVNDNIFLIVMVGMLIAVVAGAWFIAVHPALFWVSIPIIVFIVFLGSIYGNVFQNIVTSGFSGEIADFPIMQFVMNNFVYFITFFVLIIAIALFAKSRIEQEM